MHSFDLLAYAAYLFAKIANLNGFKYTTNTPSQHWLGFHLRHGITDSILDSNILSFWMTVAGFSSIACKLNRHIFQTVSPKTYHGDWPNFPNSGYRFCENLSPYNVCITDTLKTPYKCCSTKRSGLCHHGHFISSSPLNYAIVMVSIVIKNCNISLSTWLTTWQLFKVSYVIYILLLIYKSLKGFTTPSRQTQIAHFTVTKTGLILHSTVK